MANDNEILSKIQSGDTTLMEEAVKEFKGNGDLKVAQTLLEGMESTKDARILTRIANLLADIKDNAFKEVLVRQFQNATQPEAKAGLLRIIWESSLDYSAYLDLFLKILRQDDFVVALEASTVIENMVHHLTPEQHQQLHRAIDTFPEDKQFLVENIHAEMECCAED